MTTINTDNMQGLKIKQGNSATNEKHLVIKQGSSRKLVWAYPSIYLQSDGNQYIETNYIPVQGDIIETEFMSTTGGTSTAQCVYSAGTGTYQTLVLFDSVLMYVKYFGAGTAPHFTVSLQANTFHTIKMGYNGTTKLDNSSVPTPYGGALDGSDTTLWLYKRRNNAAPLKGALKYFKITNGNTVKMHLIPVPAGMVIGNTTITANCMFDIVTQTPFYNAGSGTFTYGVDQ